MKDDSDTADFGTSRPLPQPQHFGPIQCVTAACDYRRWLRLGCIGASARAVSFSRNEGGR